MKGTKAERGYGHGGQARFYVEHLGADFSDYLKESAGYAQGLQLTVEALQTWGRYR